MTLVICLAAVLLVHALLLVPTSKRDVRFATHSLHSKLAASLLDGRIDINTDADNDVATLPDGKQYLTGGIVPALVRLPLVAIMGEKWASVAARILTAVAGAVAALLLVLRARALCAPWLRQVDIFLLVLWALYGTEFVALGSTSISGWETQTTAMVLGMFGVAGLLGKKLQWRMTGMVLIAAAIATRASIVVLVPALLVLAVLVGKASGGKRSWRGLLKEIAWLSVPLAFVAVWLVSYNLLRYGDPLESGVQYQTASRSARLFFSYGLVSPTFFNFNFHYYLVKPLTWVSEFPFVEPHFRGNAIWSHQLAIILPPLALVASFCTAKKSAIKPWQQLAFRLLTVCTAGWLVYLYFLLNLYVTGWVTFGNRYLLDAAPLLLGAVTIACATLGGTMLSRALVRGVLIGSIVIHLLGTIALRQFLF